MKNNLAFTFFILFILLQTSCQYDPTKILFQPNEITVNEVIYAEVKASNPLAIHAKEFGIDVDGINNMINTKLGNIELTAQIFNPPSPSIGQKKVVIIFHGGAFLPGMGNKGDFNIQSTCMYFAQRGVTAVAAEYRLMNILTPSFYKAGYVATQDGKAIVRYIANHSADYNINPEEIFLMGYSAGAVTALHTGFLETQENIDGRNRKLSEMYGHLDAVGEQAVTPFNIRGIINIAGGVFDTAILNNDIPVLSCHGDQDEIIPLICDFPFKENSVIYNKMLKKGQSLFSGLSKMDHLLEEAKVFKICGSKEIDKYIASVHGPKNSELEIISGAKHSFMFSQNGLLTQVGQKIMDDLVIFVKTK